jgi:hypothetical protein
MPSCSSPSASGGGYLQEKIVDAANSPRRTETTPPAMITTQFFYDLVGNIVRRIDGRGNDTLYTVNQLNQVVETQSELPYRSTEYTFYDNNNNVIEKDKENQEAVVSNGAPVFTGGGNFATQDGTPAFFKNFYTFDILDDQVKKDLDATGSVPARVVTLLQYDANQNQTQKTLPGPMAGIQATSRISIRLPSISGIGEWSATLRSTHPSSTLSNSSLHSSSVLPFAQTPGIGGISP